VKYASRVVDVVLPERRRVVSESDPTITNWRDEDMLDHKEAISREELEKRAYELYLRRGAEHGHDEEDWLLAEAQLTEERNRGPETSKSFKTQSAGR
jgi:hypothetical protein